ncbi:MAG: TldD/PmbA family protein [Planctomycetota bacterium]|nr:MAG: TldD/PmbA family protein [Planctomycetota bacterium]
MLAAIEARFARVVPKEADFCSLRLQLDRGESLAVRHGVLQPVSTAEDAGAMLAVTKDGGYGYAATCDLSEEGLRQAARRALRWAEETAGRSVVDFRKVPLEHPQGEYASPVETPWGEVPLEEKIDLLRAECAALMRDERIVDSSASLAWQEMETLYLTSGGGRVHQRFSYLFPGLRATANQGAETVTRTFGAYAYCRQGGLEVVDAVGWRGAATGIADEALQLLSAENCPSGTMDLLLAPDQMVLQIHESIGHPLELDRILGDERNYAGTSFVTPDMFGSYRYGSELLNVTFDPTRPEQLASYGYDDDGRPATREFVIKDGILLRPLGGTISQARAPGLQGVANSRACSWNRPPIDRMANLNLEPGESAFDEMVRSVERGIYMRTNCSWSIDDSRNKFQFGCEWAQLIEDGELTRVVKKPNYRGISATFWRNLKAVGDPSTFVVMGTPNCGKGEPNQVIRVGHASPACLFADVDVFGGE